jgi:hypothetical protein
VPRTGGLFRVTIFPSPSTPTLPSGEGESAGEEGKVLWDRKRDGGFPGMYLPFLLLFVSFRGWGLDTGAGSPWI